MLCHMSTAYIPAVKDCLGMIAFPSNLPTNALHRTAFLTAQVVFSGLLCPPTCHQNCHLTAIPSLYHLPHLHAFVISLALLTSRVKLSYTLLTRVELGLDLCLWMWGYGLCKRVQMVTVHAWPGSIFSGETA